jgi:hypothetical protein
MYGGCLWMFRSPAQASLHNPYHLQLRWLAFSSSTFAGSSRCRFQDPRGTIIKKVVMKDKRQGGRISMSKAWLRTTMFASPSLTSIEAR